MTVLPCGQAGIVNRNIAPRGWIGLAEIRPPYASMIEQLIDRPIPRRCAFAVIVRSNTRSVAVGSILVPKSFHRFSYSRSSRPLNVVQCTSVCFRHD